MIAFFVSQGANSAVMRWVQDDMNVDLYKMGATAIFTSFVSSSDKTLANTSQNILENVKIAFVEQANGIPEPAGSVLNVTTLIDDIITSYTETIEVYNGEMTTESATSEFSTDMSYIETQSTDMTTASTTEGK